MAFQNLVQKQVDERQQLYKQQQQHDRGLPHEEIFSFSQSTPMYFHSSLTPVLEQVQSGWIKCITHGFR